MKVIFAITTQALLVAAAFAATTTTAPHTREFTNGESTKVKGVIISRDGDTIKLRGEDDAVGTVNLTDATKVQLKHGMFGMSKSTMDVTALLPGLRIEAEGKGNEKGELVANKVTFDPNSMKASRQIDTRVSPLEARTGQIEGRTGTLEGRAGQLETRAGTLETRAGQMEDAQKQTQQQVGEVKIEADQANQGVDTVNKRVSDLDDYETKFSTTVYFKLNSSALSEEGKKDLAELAEKAHAEKGYMIEVAGFADKTGSLSRNQTLSEARADSVVRFLQQDGDVPLRRILAPAGLGISHEAADNSTPQGRKMNRRVEVKVIVNRGVTAMSQPPGTDPTAKPANQASNK